MTELIVTRGLPASGKSTWAKAWVAADPQGRVRVNRDDLRMMMFGSYWGEGVDEKAVTDVEEAMVKAALAKGKSVVVDATHLKASYASKWYKFSANVSFQDFPYPPRILVETDRERMERGERGVGAAVILEMARRYHIKEDGILPEYPRNTGALPYFAPYIPGEAPAYSFDIDGTLARMVARGPYDTSLYHTDVADRSMSELFWHLQDAVRGSEVPAEFLVLSGRDEEFKPVLIEWLKGWSLDIPEENIFMRPKGDLRNDAIIKSELVDKHYSGVYDVIMHFDDRNRVVDALRSKGMKVAQVEPGDF